MTTNIPYDQVGIASFDTTDVFTQAELFNSAYPQITTEDFEVAVSTTLKSFAVVGLNTAGKLVMATDDIAGGSRATDTATFSGVGTANDTITIDGQVYKLVAAPAAANDVLIGASAAATAVNLIAAIEATPSGAGTLYGAATVEHATVEARSNASGVVGLLAKTAGAAGNAIAVTKSSTAITLGAATLTGGADDVGVKAIGVTTAGIITDGSNPKRIAIYRSGNFNPAALAWDPTFDTDAKKMAAFRGAPTPTNIIVRPRL